MGLKCATLGTLGRTKTMQGISGHVSDLSVSQNSGRLFSSFASPRERDVRVQQLLKGCLVHIINIVNVVHVDTLLNNVGMHKLKGQ